MPHLSVSSVSTTIRAPNDNLVVVVEKLEPNPGLNFFPKSMSEKRDIPPDLSLTCTSGTLSISGPNICPGLPESYIERLAEESLKDESNTLQSQRGLLGDRLTQPYTSTIDEQRITELDSTTSSPASEPGSLGSGKDKTDHLDSLALLDNDLGENRVNFVIVINGATTRILIDTGAKKSYISKSYVTVNKLSSFKLRDQPMVHGVWGKPHQIESSTHFTFKLEGLTFCQPCRIAPLSMFDVILGMDWINNHAVSTEWVTGMWTLRDKHGKTTQFDPRSVPTPPQKTHYINGIGEVLEENSPLNRHQMRKLMRRQNAECYVLLMDTFPDGLNSVNEVEGPREELDSELPKIGTTDSNLAATAQKLLKKFSQLFEPITKAPTTERVLQHLIDTGDSAPVSQPVRKLSPLLMEELRNKLATLQESGFIRPSTSPWSSPILFARNSSGKLRFCIDYQAVNSITKRDRHPLPLIQECFDQLHGARRFSKFDLQQGFHQMKISLPHVPKTAFSTRYGHYEWLVMPFPFGLVNAPSTFQRMMTDILRPYLDKFIQTYMDNILIYSDSDEKHVEHVELVLTALQKAELQISGPKSVMFAEEMQFVGHMISKEGIRPMKDKIEAINSWPRTTDVHKVRQFLGLTGYYRRFVKDFSKISSPLHALTGGNVGKKAKIVWGPAHELAFASLKERLVSAPV